MTLTDSCMRKIEYLRFSVTDHCNIRCQYCMPVNHEVLEKRKDILNFDEIERMVRILIPLGIRRVRLTGGEPLVRKDLPVLIKKLHLIPGLEEVLLTTNGIPLKTLAKPLYEAGLKKINIHLDTLSPEKFWRVTRGGSLERVLEGIHEAQRVGFSPIKLNAVIQKGINDGEGLDELLSFSAKEGLILRLIEMMPIGPGRDLMPSLYVPYAEIQKQILKKYTLIPSTEKVGGGPAVYFRIPELNTLIGFIHPISEPFCNECNRIRISSDGRFQDCLAFDGVFSFRELLRNPLMTDEKISEQIKKLILNKPESHDGFLQDQEIRTPCMAGIGG